MRRTYPASLRTRVGAWHGRAPSGPACDCGQVATAADGRHWGNAKQSWSVWLAEQMRTGPGPHDAGVGRIRDVGSEQAEHATSEAAADEPRAAGASGEQALQGGLDGGGGDLV